MQRQAQLVRVTSMNEWHRGFPGTSNGLHRVATERACPLEAKYIVEGAERP